MNKLNFTDCVQSKYQYTGNFYEGLASVTGWNELYGFINRKGKEVIECQYVDVLDFQKLNQLSVFLASLLQFHRQ